MVLPRFTIPEEQQVVVPEQTMRDAVASSLISAAEAARGTTDTARRAFGTPLRRFDDSCTSEPSS